MYTENTNMNCDCSPYIISSDNFPVSYEFLSCFPTHFKQKREISAYFIPGLTEETDKSIKQKTQYAFLPCSCSYLKKTSMRTEHSIIQANISIRIKLKLPSKKIQQRLKPSNRDLHDTTELSYIHYLLLKGSRAEHRKRHADDPYVTLILMKLRQVFSLIYKNHETYLQSTTNKSLPTS